MPKRLKIHYRRADFVGGPPGQGTLQALLTTALRKRVDDVRVEQRVRHRMMELEDGGKLVLNSSQVLDNFVFGEVAAYDPGLAIRVIEDMAEQETLNLHQLPTPAGNHPVREVTYFLVRNNHVSLFEASSLRTSHLERFVNWLLRDKTETLNADTRIFMSPHVQYNGARRAHTASLKPPALEIRPPIAADDEAAVVPVLRERLIQGDQTYDILRAAGSTDADIESLVRQVGNSGRLQLTLGVTVFNGSRKAETSAINLEHLMRHADEDEITLYDKDGQSRGTIRRLMLPMTVDMDGAYVVRGSARQGLLQALGVWVERGYITLGPVPAPADA